MKKTILSVAFGALLVPAVVNAEQLKGLNIIMTSGDTQTQMMGMVLSGATLNVHKKQVNITLCSEAGKLALKDFQAKEIKKADGTKVNPKAALAGLIKGGANVTVCPLFLPNVDKDTKALIDGVTVAKPPVVAEGLLNSEFNTLNF